ncbi:MAG TPA: helix-turn-helix transcriptional regulator [Eubacteriales bacterium]|nr:helix-turn-helix transcriptional regulator [Eubacteriales bacterium]
MQLSKKIYYCRTKARLSQEALAEKIGVSRQAVSKWENGDAEPEIGKLRLLADAFGVTVDWLLSDAEPEETGTQSPEPTPAVASRSANWVDSIPGVIGKLLRRYGWLFGVYLSVTGAGFMLIGGLARYLTRRMFSGFTDSAFSGLGGSLSGGTVYFDEFGNMVNNTASGFAANNPVSIMGTVILVIGLVMIVAGIILAVVLKKQQRQ